MKNLIFNVDIEYKILGMLMIHERPNEKWVEREHWCKKLQYLCTEDSFFFGNFFRSLSPCFGTRGLKQYINRFCNTCEPETEPLQVWNMHGTWWKWIIAPLCPQFANILHQSAYLIDRICFKDRIMEQKGRFYFCGNVRPPSPHSLQVWKLGGLSPL